MRINIATRLFLALVLTSLVILTMSAGITRWNFERGFLDYVVEQEAEMLASLATSLEDIYRNDGNWDSLRASPRRWSGLLRSGDTRERPLAGNRRPPPAGRPPPPDRFEMRHRVALLDPDGRVLIGPQAEKSAAQSVPIIVDGATVGSLTMAPREKLTSQIDQNFARNQGRSIYVTAAAALLIAALLAALISRPLTRSIRQLTAGARSISAGNYAARIEAIRRDELGDLANDFNRLALTLESNRRARQRWIADIAHELRTPLAILRGELDAIEDKVREFDTTTRKSLQAEVARLSKLIDDLHFSSNHENEMIETPFQQVDVLELLNQCLDNASNRLQHAGIALTRSLPQQTADMLCDATGLERLFTNLLENSLRYTNAPGSLHVDGSIDARELCIQFSDSAPGVPDELLEKIFERLFRVDVSRSQESGGSGLGLSICRAIVAAHRGTISASQSKSGGLTVTVRLPLGALQEHPG